MLLPQVDLAAKCATDVVLPTGDVKIEDGALSSGAENYKEFWYTMVGLAGEGQNFDGNGMYVRFQPGGGDQTVSLGALGRTDRQAVRQRGPQAAGHAARLPGQAPALQARRALLQERAAEPQRGADRPGRRRRGGGAGEPAAGGAQAMKTAIRKHARDFAFVLGLVLVSALVGGYILSNQRFYLPHWVPVVGSDFVDYKAEFSTAQSVTPGQGQTVQIAGVDVGDITKVDLVDGRAVVTMKIRRKYLPIYKNATALLRPKTGLNDMVIELNPGSQTAGTAPAGFTVPIDQTLPNVNFDEILSSLDTDTRTYLQLLVGGAGEGLDGQGKPLSAALKRFEPTGRYLARLNGALAVRERNIRRAIHNFSLLSQAVGAKDDDLAAARRLVQPGLQGLRRPGRQPARRRCRSCPGPSTRRTRRWPRSPSWATCSGRPSARCGPAPAPSGRRWSRRVRSCTETTPIIQNQLRPFARDALPVVTVLRPAARDLALVTPKLTTSVQVLNYLLNELAYNPPGKEEGYLYWASWANHDGATVFSTQDAHGPIRHGLVLASCSTLQVLHQLSGPVPQLGTLGALLNPPDQNVVCPGTTSQAGSTPAQPGTTTPTVPAPTLPVRGQGRTR